MLIFFIFNITICSMQFYYFYQYFQLRFNLVSVAKYFGKFRTKFFEIFFIPRQTVGQQWNNYLENYGKEQL